jgi:phosphomannomutase
MFSEHIFRSYDIRGIYGPDLTEEIMQGIGNVFGQLSRGIVVARDSRLSSQLLLDSFAKGASQAAEVVNIGEVPSSAALHFSTSRNMPLAYITASHLSKEWNGVKFFHANGHGFMDTENMKVKEMFFNNNFVRGASKSIAAVDPNSVIDDYVKNIASSIRSLSNTKILVDCGNGVAGLAARKAFSATGFNADIIFEEPDGSFPNRKPDPISDPLKELVTKMHNYDIGFAYDGDADRVVFASKDGKIMPEQASFVMLSELAKLHDGPIVANIECSTLMNHIARKLGRELHYCKVGYTFLMEAVKKHNAMFGMEVSSHYFVPALAKYSDVIATSMYLCYALQKTGKSVSNMISELPQYHVEKKNYDCSDARKFSVISELQSEFSGKYDVNTLDGIRIDLDSGSVLIRASNTEPLIRASVESRNQKRVEELKDEFLVAVERKIAS